ncbi:MAG: S9 family peptidase [Bacteroidetes bacterium HGW-Bacteroidetes-1]|jgi:dipeptidyl-peptidase-4|nr:MAG: S9 family peptidase [Bacteroidetes bacterium HGW-Bacteroidetes-1]
MNKFFFLFAFLISTSVLQTKAQTKLFTPEDAAGLNTSLYPSAMSQLQWLADEDTFTYVDGRVMLKGNVHTSDLEQILTMDKINASLEEINVDSVKRFPQMKWITSQSAYFFHQKKLFNIVLPSGKILQITQLPEEAANLEVNLPSLNIAYTVENNLFVAIGNQHIKITSDGEGIVNGQTVHRNEFGISKGIFWSPDGKKIAFYHMDESMVTPYPLVDISKRISELKNERYPMAGMTSHEVLIGVFDLEQKNTIFLKTGLPSEQYLTSVTWHPDSKSVFAGILNREQAHLEMKQFDAVSGEELMILFEERDEKYVEPLHPLYFVEESNELFVWVSQRDGFKHLYLYKSDGKLVRQLTSGEWIVSVFLGFDPKGTKAYFTATKESPLEQNTYSVDFKAASIQRITPEKGVHSTQISKSGKYAIDNYSNTSISREITLLQTNGKTLRILKENANPLKEYRLGETTLFSIPASDGTQLFCRMIKPIDFDSTKKYPVIVYVYGGPHAQMITERWLGGANFYLNYLAQKGYIVFTLDNRGSDNRGRAFEQVIHRNAGKTETEDQMQGIQYLQSLSYVDTEKIGVDGWSYGGFMAISLKLNHPEVFKVAVAGGPVIDWKYYEVMYGERYMDTPQTNPEGYEQSSMLNKVDKLEGKLMLIHGDMDPVVVWQNSLSFLKKCVDEGKLVDYFVYPGHEHNVRGRDRAHLIRKISTYFDENLMK